MAFNYSAWKLFLGLSSIVFLLNQGKCDPNVASILAYPSFVAVESNNEHVCSGAVVDHRYVITSGHCSLKFDLDRDAVNVRVGMDRRGFRGEVINVVANYTDAVSMMGANATDMAVLKLATHIRYKSKASWSNLAMVFMSEGLEGVVPLWLDTKFKSALSSVMVKVLNHADCVSLYQGIQTIDDTMECLETVNAPELACLVDIGSPFLAQEQVFGIVTYPATCDVTNTLPMVVTSVTNTANFVVIAMTGIGEIFKEIMGSND